MSGGAGEDTEAPSRAPASGGVWREGGAAIPEAATWVGLILRDSIQQGCEIINTFSGECDRTRALTGVGRYVRRA